MLVLLVGSVGVLIGLLCLIYLLFTVGRLRGTLDFLESVELHHRFHHPLV